MQQTALVRLISVAFPASVFVFGTYACLHDAVFGIFVVIRNRMHPSLIKACRRCYGVLNACACVALLYGILTRCDVTQNLCEATSLQRTECFLATAIGLFALIAMRFFDRMFVLLFCIREERKWSESGYGTRFSDRIKHAACICVCWLALSSTDASMFPVLILSLARRALLMLPASATVVCATTVRTVFTIQLIDLLVAARNASADQRLNNSNSNINVHYQRTNAVAAFLAVWNA
jgi:hypothetical protein